MPTTTDDSEFDVEQTYWDFIARADPREYYARKRERVNPLRATPFVHDIQLRSVFETVKVGGLLL